MNTTSLFRSHRRKTNLSRRRNRHRHLLLEQLEDRRLLAVGDSPLDPGASALDILNQRPGAPDGVYWIDPAGPAGAVSPFEVYANMTTDGGGWMLSVNSGQGSEAPSSTIDANLGTPDLASGHTRDLTELAINRDAEIRHEILGGGGVYDAKYTGRHATTLPSEGAWSVLVSSGVGANYLAPTILLVRGSFLRESERTGTSLFPEQTQARHPLIPLTD